MRRRLGLLLAVVGPGVIAGLSDDDPAGITTYAVVGAEHGYRLLWVLLIATGMLVLYHLVGVRVGAATGQGLVGLIRERFGVRVAAGILACLVVANLGTLAAEYAGIAAALGMLGVPRWLAVGAAAVAISTLVLRASFHRVERVLLGLGALLAAYVAAGLLAGPDPSEALRGLLVPGAGDRPGALALGLAVVGTTIAPWGLSFIQSYAVDKRIRPSDLRLESVDIVVGALLTGLIGAFVVIACAATLHAAGVGIDSAVDAARALEPLAGGAASLLFGVGLLAAGVLAAAVVPLATAYSAAEAVGTEARLDDPFGEARLFYGSFLAMTGVAATAVALPYLPLLPILVATQILNAVLLVPILVLLARLAGDAGAMGELRAGRPLLVLLWACALGLGAASLALLVDLLR